MTSLDRRQFLGVATVVVPTVGGCLGAVDSNETTSADVTHQMTIAIDDGQFSPSSLEVAAGHEVTLVFENHDDRERSLHIAFATIGLQIPSGETASREVTIPEKPGTYDIVSDTSNSVFELEAVPAELLDGRSLGSDE